MLGPSVFLLEARAACERGAGAVERWDDAPEDNPLVVTGRGAGWPATTPPAGPSVAAAAERVRALVAAPPPRDDEDLGLDPEAAALVAGWDDDLGHLAEEARRRRTGRSAAVLPAHLSVTSLVELRRDPGGLARSLLRPLPRRPSPVTRRGTAFHAWLEQTVFGTPQLLDPLELPGSADEVGADADLAELQESFRRSAWWGRRPDEIEVPFEMVVEGVLVRGRVDAVYVTGDAVEIVDWKTGPVPQGAAADAAAVQLAAYRLAWHQLTGVPLDRITAAFHHVAAGRTVRPADLLDEQGLRALVRGVPLAP